MQFTCAIKLVSTSRWCVAVVVFALQSAAVLADVSAQPAPVAGVASAEPAVGDETLTSTASSLPAERQAEILEQLRQRWASRRGEIVTADIRYRQMTGSTVAPKLSPAAVAALVQRFDLTSHPETFGDLVTELRGGALSRIPPWAESRIVWEGDSSMYAVDGFRQVRHRDLELLYDGDNQQTGVYPRGKSLRYFPSESEFRWVPRADLPDDVFFVTGVDGQAVSATTRNHDARVVFDLTSGLQLYKANLRSAGRDLWRETWYQGLAQFGDEIPFPTVKIQATYADGLLTNYRVQRIESADFNQPLAADVFQSPLAAGEAVIDYRGEQKTAYRQRDDTSDLAASLPPPRNRTAASTPGLPEDASSPFNWLLTINGVLLIGIGVLIFRRDRRKAAEEEEAARRKAKSITKS